MLVFVKFKFELLFFFYKPEAYSYFEELSVHISFHFPAL